MNIVKITKEDTVCYWTFKPKHFPNMPGCLKLDDKIQFSSSNEYCVSVNSKLLTEDFPDAIHRLGNQQAFRLSKRNKHEGKKATETYMGFLEAEVGQVENIRHQTHNFSVLHCPENDNDAHCHIQLNFPSKEMKRPVKSIKNQMVDELQKLFGDYLTQPA